MGRLNDGSPSDGGSGKMKPGDIRIITARDHKTGEVIKTYTLIRTDREYCYDLCDAYNRELTNPALEYFVDGSKQVRLGTNHGAMMNRLKHDKANAERERRRWIANHRDEYAEAAEHA